MKTPGQSVLSVGLQYMIRDFFQEALEYVRATRADGVCIGPPGLIQDVETVAVRPGDEVVLSATGFGPADPAPRVRVWIDTVEAEVVSAAYSAPGIFDVHIKIPELKVGDYPVTADVDGVRTTKFVRIPVQPRDE